MVYNDWIDNKPRDPKGISVVGTNIMTEEKLYFDAISDSDKYGFTHQAISACINGKRKSHKGYKWHLQQKIIIGA
jgi:hypothetical protein